jgi:transcriptional regulator with XRE-family HTH domain
MRQTKQGPDRPGPDLRAAVAERIRAERARQQLSQEELAHLSGLSRVHVGAIERGEVTCSVTALWQIATALAIDARELLPAPTWSPAGRGDRSPLEYKPIR